MKEMIQFSKDTLEKIDKARSEGLYHEVRALLTEDSDGEEDGEGGREVCEEKRETTEQVALLEGCFSSCPSILAPTKDIFSMPAEPNEIWPRRAEAAGP